MRRFRPVKALKFLVFLAIATAIGGFVVMLLWNWLLPPLAGWHTLTFLRAVGLLLLCRILFVGFRGLGGPGPHGRFRPMSAEERERFRAEMRSRVADAS